MSRVTFSSGDSVKLLRIPLTSKSFSDMLPIDMEILAMSSSELNIKIYYFSRHPIARKKNFIICKTGEELPKNDFQYYFFVGTVLEKGLHVFEVV
jgi:hypothetical protein